MSFEDRDKKAKSGERRRTGPKKATPERLQKAALAYLERYATSTENFRRVLMRRVTASARNHGTDPEEGAQVVDRLVTRFTELGYLDDKGYADMRVGSLHRRGVSRRAIRMKLSEKGVEGAVAEAALEELSESLEREGIDPDLQAAHHYAKRRRIGVYRRSGRDENRQRDLAALARQGFSFDIARQVIGTSGEDEDYGTDPDFY